MPCVYCREECCDCLDFPDGEHRWIHKDEGYICEDCGVYAEVSITNVVCYGGSPVELDGWWYSWFERGDENPPDCETLIMKKALK